MCVCLKVFVCEVGCLCLYLRLRVGVHVHVSAGVGRNVCVCVGKGACGCLCVWYLCTNRAWNRCMHSVCAPVCVIRGSRDSVPTSVSVGTRSMNRAYITHPTARSRCMCRHFDPNRFIG